MAQPQSTRELVIARRKAMSTTGKAAIKPNTAERTATARATAASPATSSPVARASYSTPANTAVPGARAASLARREAMSTRGKAAIQTKDRTRTDGPTAAQATAPATPAPVASSGEAEQKKGCGCGCDGTRDECKTKMQAQETSRPTVKNTIRQTGQQVANKSVARIASLARREAMSSRGKAGVSKNGMSEAQTARAGNPNLTGRDLSKALREQRSKMGGACQKKSEPCGRRRQKSNADAKVGAAQDAPWKVGVGETTQGQHVTGTMVGRSQGVTGDEPSTCRTITGTEYMGADIFREFCQTDPAASTARKVAVTSTSHGNAISGNRIGRGTNVTGNEQGTCKNVTGNQYTSAEQTQGYCGELPSKSPRKVSMAETMKGKAVTGNKVGRSERVTGDEPGMNRALTGTQYTQPSEIGNAPVKVGKSATLRGGHVTGTSMGRRERMTGDEPGSCRNVTGDDYVGQEQYQAFCDTTPAPQDRKVGISNTGKGRSVTGTMTDRDSKVTGNEPGTCKSVTGTPYSGADSYAEYCPTEDAAQASQRTRRGRGTPGMPMTGIQPGVGGVMTGASKGACEPLTGTPYIGADQFADACPATPADTASPDFPQPLSGGEAPWQQFSVTQPSGGAQLAHGSTGVTGNQYESGHITGPFGMASGKVSGTEDARYGRDKQGEALRPVVAQEVEGRVKSRISGEGQDAGLKITGDDWDRGNNVTGTEGMSSTRRNPTMRTGAMTSMAVEQKRNEELPVPNSKVTGGSGNTDKGSLITYSGGARG